MTCLHIDEARKLLAKLVNKLRDQSDMTIRENTKPYIVPGSVEPYLDQGFFKNKYGARWTEEPISVISWRKVEDKIDEIDNELSKCNCYSNEKIKRENENSRKDDLLKSHSEAKKLLATQIKELKGEYKETIDRQLSIIESEKKENSLIRTENSKLQKALGLSEAQAKQLEIRLSEKTNDLRVSEQALSQLRQAFLDLSISNATNATRVQVIGEQLDWTKIRLENSDERIAEKERKLDQKQQQYEGVQESLTNLRIKYKTEITDKDNELKNREKEIKLLKNQAEKSQKELLEERLELKQEKIEEFADELEIDLEQVNSFRSYYENLIVARQNHNSVDISINERIIAEFKQGLLNKGIKYGKVKKFDKRCEKVAKIRLELGIKSSSTPRVQTQTNTAYSFGRERSWKNINPNFTPELVQEWKNYGFTYEECADWININSPNQQGQAIKEPAYYAWLRDVKQVDSYWVLNEGNEQKLSQEFFRWYQQNKYQARQEFPTNNNF